MRSYVAWVIQWDEGHGGDYLAAGKGADNWRGTKRLNEALQLVRRIDARHAIETLGLMNCRPVEKTFG